MTPCYICGGPVSEVRLDPRDMKIRPCLRCEEVISSAAFEREKDRQEEQDEEFMHTSLDDYLSTKRVYNDVD